MDKKNTAEAIGIIAVVLSLLFVAYQIQQANRIAGVTNEIEVRNNFSSINESIMNDGELAELLARLYDENPQFTPGEQIRINMWSLRLMNVWLAAETAYVNGMLPEESYRVLFDDIASLFNFSPAQFKPLEGHMMIILDGNHMKSLWPLIAN